MIRSQETQLAVNAASKPDHERKRFTVSEIINLRQARKRQARAKQEETAAINRAKHGQTKLERAIKRAEAETLRKILDGAKRDDPAK